MTNNLSAQKVCNVHDVDTKSAHLVTIGGVSIAVFLADGEYYAVENVCPHQGGPLNKGKVEDGCVYCPWHGWKFDLETGEHVHGEASATVYDVQVCDDEIFIEC